MTPLTPLRLTEADKQQLQVIQDHLKATTHSESDKSKAARFAIHTVADLIATGKLPKTISQQIVKGKK